MRSQSEPIHSLWSMVQSLRSDPVQLYFCFLFFNCVRFSALSRRGGWMSEGGVEGGGVGATVTGNEWDRACAHITSDEASGTPHTHTRTHTHSLTRTPHCISAHTPSRTNTSHHIFTIIQSYFHNHINLFTIIQSCFRNHIIISSQSRVIKFSKLPSPDILY